MRRPTLDQLAQLLHYDPLTGAFTWRVDRRMGRTGKGHLIARAGDAAGSVDSQTGYLNITATIDGQHYRYAGHRLAVLFMTGEWPTHHVDHRDGCRLNNRWKNLREVTQEINNQNQRRARSDNESGLIGAHFNKRTGKFRSSIKTAKKYQHLGTFDSAEEAHQAYIAAKRVMHAGCTI